MGVVVFFENRIPKVIKHTMTKLFETVKICKTVLSYKHVKFIVLRFQYNKLFSRFGNNFKAQNL